MGYYKFRYKNKHYTAAAPTADKARKIVNAVWANHPPVSKLKLVKMKRGKK